MGAFCKAIKAKPGQSVCLQWASWKKASMVVETCLNLCPKDGFYIEKLKYVFSLLTEKAMKEITNVNVSVFTYVRKSHVPKKYIA